MSRGAAGQTRRTLLILTNDYPFAGGDGSFVHPELDALASRFDAVAVANYSRSGGSVGDLPPGVEYLGNLFEQSRGARIRALLNPASLAVLWRSIRRERRAGRGPLRSELRAAVVGLTVAAHPALRTLLADRNSQVTVYAFWGMGAALALPWLRSRAAGIAVRLHRYDLFEDAPASPLPLRMSLFDAADSILCISEQGRRYLAEKFGSAVDARTVVRRLGTFDAGIGPSTPAAPAGTVTVVSCSSLTPVKRVDRIFGALRNVASADRPVRWVHFGGGPLDAELRDLVASTPHPFLEVDLRGHTDNAGVLAFYREHPVDVFVNASESEGVPVSIMEALSFGIPVVATDVGGTGEIVGRELGSGVLASATGAPEELADGIVAVLSSPQSFAPRDAWRERSDARLNADLTAKTVAETGTGQRS